MDDEQTSLYSVSVKASNQLKGQQTVNWCKRALHITDPDFKRVIKLTC